MSHSWSEKDFVEAYFEWLTENPDDRVASLVDRVIQESAEIVARTNATFTHYDALVLDLERRVHGIPEPARQWYRDLVDALGFRWDKITPAPQTQQFKTALKATLHFLDSLASQDQTLTAIYRAWAHSSEKRFRMPKSKFSNTLGWTTEQIQNQIDIVLQDIDYTGLSEDTRKWWDGWNRVGVTAPAVILKRAEELANLGSKIETTYRIFKGEANQDWKTTLQMLDLARETDIWTRRVERGQDDDAAKWESLLALPLRDGQLDLESMTDQDMESNYQKLLKLIGWPTLEQENRVSISKPVEQNVTSDSAGKTLLYRWDQMRNRAGYSSLGVERMIRLTETLEFNEISWDTFLRGNADKSDTTVLGQVYRANLYKKNRKGHFHLAFEYGSDAIGHYADMIVQVRGSDDPVRQRMRWIPAGEFEMGSPSSEQGRKIDEVHHPVTLSQGYWMFDTPCTQRLWTTVMGSNPSFFLDLDRPVEKVSWIEVQKFVEILNNRLAYENSMPLRLPTEAEWEYACRAGTKTATYQGDFQLRSDDETKAQVLDSISWYGGNSGHAYDLEKSVDMYWLEDLSDGEKNGGTRKVAQKTPNTWGLHDMLGNVWEWCQDWYEEYPSSPVEDPTGPASGTLRVIRGGGWFDPARNLRSACRVRLDPGDRDDVLGFRLLSSAHQVN